MKTLLAFALLIASIPCQAAIAYVNSAGTFSSGTSIALTSYVLNLHDTVAVLVNCKVDSGQTQTVSDGTNTYTAQTKQSVSSGAELQWFVAKNVAAGTVTITATISSSCNSSMFAYSYSGVDLTTPVETDRATDHANSTTFTSASFNTTAANTAVLYGCGTNNDGSVTVTVGSGYGHFISEDSPDAYAQDRIYTTAQTGVTATMDATSSLIWGCNLLVLKAAGGVTVTLSPVLRVVSNGSVPGMSGCSADTQTGGDTIGTFTSRTSGTCTVTLTFAQTAKTGWYCVATDQTTPADVVTQTGSDTTTCTVAGTTVTGDVIVFSARAF